MMWDGYYIEKDIEKDTVKEKYDLLDNPKVSLGFYRAQQEAEELILLLDTQNNATNTANNEVLTYLTNYNTVLLHSVSQATNRYELYNMAIEHINKFFREYDKDVIDIKLKEMGIISVKKINTLLQLITVLYIILLFVIYCIACIYITKPVAIISVPIMTVLWFSNMCYVESIKRVRK